MQNEVAGPVRAIRLARYIDADLCTPRASHDLRFRLNNFLA